MKRRVSTAKRIVAVALAATVAVSLTGCKKKKTTPIRQARIFPRAKVRLRFRKHQK